MVRCSLFGALELPGWLWPDGGRCARTHYGTTRLLVRKLAHESLFRSVKNTVDELPTTRANSGPDLELRPLQPRRYQPHGERREIAVAPSPERNEFTRPGT